MAAKIVIVGAGPGGCMVANRIARSMRKEVSAGDIEIILLSDTPQHVYEAAYLFMALGMKRPDEFTKPQQELLDPRVALVIDPAHRIDLDRHAVIGSSGRDYTYDILVVSTGSRVRPDITPGLAEGGADFYTLEGTTRLRGQLADFGKGRILCAVEMPHKCPVAFLELLFMLNDYYRRKGVRDKITLSYTYPLDAVHQKPEVGRFCKPLLDQAGIGYETGFVVDSVDASKKRVTAKDGRQADYDLLVTIPTHRAPAFIRDSGLGDAQGWIQVDPGTLKMTGAENVYVVGDATNLHTKGVSKAGSAAHYQSEVVAGNIVDGLRGVRGSRIYDGKVFCFMETGLDTATCIQFDYATPPALPPASTLLHWFKLSFNELYWAATRGIL